MIASEVCAIIKATDIIVRFENVTKHLQNDRSYITYICIYLFRYTLSLRILSILICNVPINENVDMNDLCMFWT